MLCKMYGITAASEIKKSHTQLTAPVFAMMLAVEVDKKRSKLEVGKSALISIDIPKVYSFECDVRTVGDFYKYIADMRDAERIIPEVRIVSKLSREVMLRGANTTYGDRNSPGSCATVGYLRPRDINTLLELDNMFPPCPTPDEMEALSRIYSGIKHGGFITDDGETVGAKSFLRESIPMFSIIDIKYGPSFELTRFDLAAGITTG
jgi:hypothetical protein